MKSATFSPPVPEIGSSSSLLAYTTVRQATETLCAPLEPEDYVVQPIEDVSPPKWHLAHTTWFFETFVLKGFVEGYQEFHPDFGFLFNSYYESVGTRTIRAERGNLTRPTVSGVYAYRKYVDAHVERFLSGSVPEAVLPILELGLNHEQQHQELLLTDLKYILGHNPLFPVYREDFAFPKAEGTGQWIQIPEGVHSIGYAGSDFCFDNEKGVHQVYLNGGQVYNHLVTNREYLEFVEAGGYQDFRFWLAEGWAWVNTEQRKAPLYWHFTEGQWHRYGLAGFEPVRLDDPVSHVSYFEADAFAQWKGMRLPTEFEWEVLHPQLHHGSVWEWTQSAYLPYPGFAKAAGALGEYNGKFMVSQMVLRGGSVATAKGHFRPTYRNFFHPHLRWQFTGIRLARN
ncbi:MAG: ergothioneine biosynthesis protein EgtB [Salibacteraceae bacterium]